MEGSAHSEVVGAKSKTLASPFSIYFPPNRFQGCLPPSLLPLSACICKCTEGPVQNFLLYIHSGPAQLHSECPFKVPACSSESALLEVPTTEQSLLWSTNVYLIPNTTILMYMRKAAVLEDCLARWCTFSTFQAFHSLILNLSLASHHPQPQADLIFTDLSCDAMGRTREVQEGEINTFW